MTDETRPLPEPPERPEPGTPDHSSLPERTDRPQPPAAQAPAAPQPQSQPHEFQPDYWAQGPGAGQQPSYYPSAAYGAPGYGPHPGYRTEPAYGPRAYGEPGYGPQYPGYPAPGPYAGGPGGPRTPDDGPGGPGGPGGHDGRGEPDGHRSHPVRRTALIAAVVAALIGGGVGAGTVALAGDNGTPTASAGLQFSTQQAPTAKVDGTVTAAAAKIGPSVVTINVSGQQEADTGSGVIIREDGYILTNNHVIAAAANGGGTIQVVFKNGQTARATIAGTDPSDDLAVIKVDKSGLTAATFASSKSLQVGQTVVAVGAPLGLSDTVTAGIVSTLARPVTTSDNNNTATFNAIQTDAAINPGNSGGPLVNLNGDVVGINAAIASDQSRGGLQIPGSQPGNIGIGFAIPSDEASRIANELISTGHATHAVIGVGVCNASRMQCPASGALILEVNSGSPAERVGLKKGDVVTKLGDQLIPDSDSLIAAVRSHAPGSRVELTYTRDGDSHTVTLTLGTATD